MIKTEENGDTGYTKCLEERKKTLIGPNIISCYPQIKAARMIDTFKKAINNVARFECVFEAIKKACDTVAIINLSK